MAEQTSSTLTHLFELLTKIDNQKRIVFDAEENVKTAKAELTKLESEVANPLKEYNLGFIPEAKEESSEEKGAKFLAPKRKMESQSERKPRSSADVVTATINRNRLAYNPEHYKEYLGVNKAGEPVKYKGRGPKNKEITNVMEQNIRDYEAQYGSFETPITEESLLGEHKFLLEPVAANEAGSAEPEAGTEAEAKPEGKAKKAAVAK